MIDADRRAREAAQREIERIARVTEHRSPTGSRRRRRPSSRSYETGGLRLALLVGGRRWRSASLAGWAWRGDRSSASCVMIFLHELGHFVTAKWSGMKVTEFFIGFGPRIWSFQPGRDRVRAQGHPGAVPTCASSA